MDEQYTEGNETLLLIFTAPRVCRCEGWSPGGSPQHHPLDGALAGDRGSMLYDFNNMKRLFFGGGITFQLSHVSARS